jgi:hypothetical protein
MIVRISPPVKLLISLLQGAVTLTRSPGFIDHIQECAVESAHLTVDEDEPGSDAGVPPDDESDPTVEIEIRIVLQDSA